MWKALFLKISLNVSLDNFGKEGVVIEHYVENTNSQFILEVIFFYKCCPIYLKTFNFFVKKYMCKKKLGSAACQNCCKNKLLGVI